MSNAELASGHLVPIEFELDHAWQIDPDSWSCVNAAQQSSSDTPMLNRIRSSRMRVLPLLRCRWLAFTTRPLCWNQLIVSKVDWVFRLRVSRLSHYLQWPRFARVDSFAVAAVKASALCANLLASVSIHFCKRATATSRFCLMKV